MPREGPAQDTVSDQSRYLSHRNKDCVSCGSQLKSRAKRRSSNRSVPGLIHQQTRLRTEGPAQDTLSGQEKFTARRIVNDRT